MSSKKLLSNSLIKTKNVSLFNCDKILFYFINPKLQNVNFMFAKTIFNLFLRLLLNIISHRKRK